MNTFLKMMSMVIVVITLTLVVVGYGTWVIWQSTNPVNWLEVALLVVAFGMGVGCSLILIKVYRDGRKKPIVADEIVGVPGGAGDPEFIIMDEDSSLTIYGRGGPRNTEYRHLVQVQAMKVGVMEIMHRVITAPSNHALSLLRTELTAIADTIEMRQNLYVAAGPELEASAAALMERIRAGMDKIDTLLNKTHED
jgi:hypothetical protein